MATKYAAAASVMRTNAPDSSFCSSAASTRASCRDHPPRSTRWLHSERMFDAASLTDQQATAVDHSGGHLLIVAGAGTGKTTTLAARVASLVERGVSPER